MISESKFNSQSQSRIWAWFSMTSSQWNNKLVKCVSLPTWSCVELAQLDMSSQMRLPKPLSHLWYGHILTNSLLSGILQQLIRKLKKVQNCSARLIFKTSKCTHASTHLTKLHWLPIAQRIKYKVSSNMSCGVVSETVSESVLNIQFIVLLLCYTTNTLIIQPLLSLLK